MFTSEGGMQDTFIEWAGVRFTPIHHHDGRFFRCPGLFAFVRRGPFDERTLLFVDHAEQIASRLYAHPLWTDALRLGFNELNVNLVASERVDRLLLRGRIIQRCEPLLNVIADNTALECEAQPALWRAAR